MFSSDPLTTKENGLELRIENNPSLFRPPVLVQSAFLLVATTFLGLGIIAFRSIGSSESLTQEEGKETFLLIWITFMSFNILGILVSLLTRISARERLALDRASITVVKENFGWSSEKSYKIADLSKLRLSTYRQSIRTFHLFWPPGTIEFLYGTTEVSFGYYLQEEEARRLLKIIKDYSPTLGNTNE